MAQKKQDAIDIAINTRDANGPRKAAEKMECCGSVTGHHKPDCPVYNRRMTETLDLLQSLSKRSPDWKSLLSRGSQGANIAGLAATAPSANQRMLLLLLAEIIEQQAQRDTRQRQRLAG